MDSISNLIHIDKEKLKKALEQNEFQIYYQPQVNLAGEIIGVEALARWFTTENGAIPPNYFIPMLEQHHLIYDFQIQLLFKACSQINHLNTTMNKMLKLSINIPPILFNQKTFLTDLRKIINEVKMPPHCIELEITETYDLNKIKNINTTLQTLKDMNLIISLDDFGKGFNSISYLIDFNFDLVKVDRKYMNIITENPNFLKGLMTMIHSTGCKVVSEGIETKEQVECLKQLNCDFFQGYYFYKPMPYNDLFAILAQII